MKSFLAGVWAIALSVALAAGALRAEPKPFAWNEATIDALQVQMATGELTAEKLTRAYLERIAEIDRQGPALHAVIEINPDALAIARELDRERRAGQVRGALHGIPVLIKDNIATADRMQTTGGSLMLVGAKPPRDAALVAQLRAAGAVILGKTNLSEWANFRGEHSVSGWSARGGQTRNPYALDRNPSGSSSGSAAAVAANLCVVAVGTETDGSITSPASTCGIVGFKPTVGLVSREGVIPISVSQDTAGPMARTVGDAARLLGAMAAGDLRDRATTERPAGLATDFAANLEAPALRGARVGVLHGPFGLNPKVEAVLNAAVAQLRGAGAEVIDLGTLPALDEAGPAELDVLLYEFKDGLNRYLASLGENARVRTLAEAMAFNTAHAAEELSAFGQELFERAEAKGPLTEQAYLDARAKCVRLVRTEGIDALMAKHRIDSIVTIASGPAWLIDHVNGDAFTGSSSSLAAIAGYPSVSVPAGEVAGLPVGIAFTGRAWSDARQLQFAADFERRAQARRRPEFPATIEAP